MPWLPANVPVLLPVLFPKAQFACTNAQPQKGLTKRQGSSLCLPEGLPSLFLMLCLKNSEMNVNECFSFKS